MGIALNDEIHRLLDGRHFAVLATINPDGGPQTSAMWVGRDGDDVLYQHNIYRLPMELRAGDQLDFLNTGAYTASYSSIAFNGFAPLPTHCL